MIRLISTDFDGTIHDNSSEKCSIAPEFLDHIRQLQADGVKWVVNTGRRLDDVKGTLYAEELEVHPDYIVSVEREIHLRQEGDYLSHHVWNASCHEEHQKLFANCAEILEEVRRWLAANFRAHVYEDPWSPLCIITVDLDEAERIHRGFLERFGEIPGLCLVRNSVYFRFAHEGFSKGTALSEIARMLQLKRDELFAAGDHHNDVSMLDGVHARWVAAPSNAIREIQNLVVKTGGFLASRPYAWGVLDALKHFHKLHQL